MSACAGQLRPDGLRTRGDGEFKAVIGHNDVACPVFADGVVYAVEYGAVSARPHSA